MAEKIIYAMYDDDDVLKDGAKKLVAKGVKVSDVFSPFPIHGIDPIIGVKNTRLGIMAFLYGITGTLLATYGMKFFMIEDWPMNIGGKPFFSLPAWIPIMFELTVLFAAVGMVLTFCYLCQLAPFVKKDHFNLRSTDDTFTMVIEANSNTNEAEVISFLQNAGATDVAVTYKETGWWIGRYDKETRVFNKQVEPSSI